MNEESKLGGNVCPKCGKPSLGDVECDECCQKLKEELESQQQKYPTLRDNNGYIIGLDYKYTDEGTIDWRAMIPSKYLYLNNDPKNRARLEKKYGKPYAEIDIIKDNVADTDLIITLAGLRALLRIHGFKEINEVIKESNQYYASVTCNVLFSANRDNEFRDTYWSSSASATLENTTSFYQKYLVEAASNRAFARCLRSYLNIAIVSREEMGSTEENPDNITSEIKSVATDPLSILKNKVSDLNWSFADFHQKIIDANNKNIELNEEGKPGRKRKVIENVETWKSYDDIPKDLLFSLTDRVNKYSEEIKKYK